MFYQTFSGVLGVVGALLVVLAIPFLWYTISKFKKNNKKDGSESLGKLIIVLVCEWVVNKGILGIALRTVFSCLVILVASTIMGGAICKIPREPYSHICLFHVIPSVFRPTMIVLVFASIVAIFASKGSDS